jgi:predicted nucleotidyltransferase
MTTIPPEKMAQYRETALRRSRARAEEERARRERAWQLARRAAALLKEQFDVDRVVVFGSLTHPGRYTVWSDIDLAAWGLTAHNWLKASAAVRELSREIDLNLVDIVSCSAELRAAIEREGISL